MFRCVMPLFNERLRLGVYSNGIFYCRSVYSSVKYLSSLQGTEYKNSQSVSLMKKIYSCTRLMRCHTLAPVAIIALPVMWSATLAMPTIVTLEHLKTFGLLSLGTFFTRSAGCCINDLADQALDRQVLRTRTRPLAMNDITRKDALITLLFNSTIALSILLQFDIITIQMGCLAAAMAVIYPFTKRFTNYPQLFLGSSFAIGTLMGWNTMTDTSFLTVQPLCIYMTSTLWTVIYDTIYAHQDREYDKQLGVKSLALHWKDTKQNSIYCLHAMTALLTACGYYGDLNDPYYLLILLSHIWMMRELYKVKLDDPVACSRFFKRNIVYGSIVLLAMIFGRDHKLNLDKEIFVV